MTKKEKQRAIDLILKSQQEHEQKKTYYWPMGMIGIATKYKDEVLPCYNARARGEFEDEMMEMTKSWAEFIATEPPKKGTSERELFDMFAEYDPNYYGGG